MKATRFLSLLAFCWLLLGAPSHAAAQCAWQDSLDCTCLDTKVCNMTICVSSMNYTVSIVYCQQLAVGGYIRNPCRWPGCDDALDQVTWIKKICVPPAIQGIGAQVIYNGIIRATNLCTDTCFGATIPTCDPGPTSPCLTGLSSASAYCHLFAFPRCYKWVAGCIEACDGDACNQYCYVQWRYCNKLGTCNRCIVSYCSDDNFSHCDQGCTEAVCTDLNDNGCTP